MRRLEGLRRLLRLLEVVLRNFRGYERSTPRPYFMVVEPTHRCNARCSYCDSWKTPASEREKELTTEEHVWLLKDARRLGVRMVSYTGGEPLLRPDLVRIALFAKSLGLRTLVNTNGYGIGENARELVSAFDAITVSIDSLDPVVQAERRGHARSLDLALRGIEALAAVRRQPAQVRVNAVVDGENLEGVADLARFFRERKVPVLLQPRHRSGLFPKVVPVATVRRLDRAEATRSVAAWLPEALGGLSKAEAAYMKPFYQGIPAHLRGEPPWFRCYAGSFSFQVGPRGDVMICQTVRKSEGNVRERPLREIWDGMIETRNYVSSDERACSCWLLCTTLNYLHADRADRVLRRLGISRVLGAWARSPSKPSLARPTHAIQGGSREVPGQSA